MKVTLRKMKLKDGNHSLFIDITALGQRTKEYLQMKIYSNPKNATEKAHNANTMALAEKIRAKKENELLNDYHGLSDSNINQDFLQFFREYTSNYPKSNKRMFRAVLNHFEAFLLQKRKTVLPGRAVTITLCEDFADYLKERLNYETPFDYFKVFRSVLRRAKKERYIGIDLEDIRVKFSNDSTAIRKAILTQDELARLFTVTPPNPEVARAFVFCLNTGLDYAMVSTHLIWANVHDDYIVFERSKTGKQNRIKLNQTAKEVLGERREADQSVFRLPSWAGAVKSIRKWAKLAGINKKITWHSARHTLGYMLVNDFNTNIRVVQEVFGHSSLKPTMRYTKIRNDVKDKAVDQLPGMKLLLKPDQDKE